MFVGVILAQRLSIPGLPVALLLPMMIGWAWWGLRRGVIEIDPRRLLLWTAAVAATAVGMLVQTLLVADPFISVTSWALFIAVWLPAVVRLTDRRPAAYRGALAAVTRAGVWLAVACLVMMASQLLGLRYRDYMADVIPSWLLLKGFVITYPISFGSPIYRANAWIGLEPSIVSFLLGAAVLAAILIRSPRWVFLVLLAALVSTASGSGILIVVVGVLAMLATRARALLLRYAPLAAVGLGVLALTPFGLALLARSGEASVAASSTSLRGVQPYAILWPDWVSNFTVTALGRGAGSSQRLLDQTGVGGLLVPTPAKIFFDYGLVAGLVLAAFLLFCFLDGPSLTIAFTLFVSLWAIQPGSVQACLIIPFLLLVTVWAPYPGIPLEREVPRRRRHRTPDELERDRRALQLDAGRLTARLPVQRRVPSSGGP